MTERPKISVCMPTYNQARYLADALRSVLNQTFQDFEVVVFDDASTDDTPSVVSSVSDARIRYFRQPCTVGIAGNRNSCLEVARGDYIAWLDSDDIYHPQMLALQSEVLDRHRNVGLVHGAYEVIDADGRRLRDWPLPFQHNVIQPGKEAFRELILSNYITAPTVMVRRQCHEQAGAYATEIGKSSTDWEMWLRIALHADLAYTATPVAQYRQHQASVSAVTVKSGDRVLCDVAATKRIFADQDRRIPEISTLKCQARAALSSKALIASGSAFKNDQRRNAISMAIRAFKLTPQLLWNYHSSLLLLAIVRNHEYAHYRHFKHLMFRLYKILEGSEYAKRISKIAVLSLDWEVTLRQIAQTVRTVVPRRAHVAFVDKYDPTIMHLSRRKGRHFPDLRKLPDGYPRDNVAAVEHLEQTRREGADYIVFPSASFWWLDYYADFRRYLDSHYRRVWADERCIIYQLGLVTSENHESVHVQEKAGALR